MSTDTKTIITILLLIFIYPIGLILMWVWTGWKTWVKVLVSLPVILVACIPLFVGLLAALNPGQSIRKAECVRQCQNSTNSQCVSSCLNNGPTSPAIK
jgi:uncharacterized protein (DUF983 family)